MILTQKGTLPNLSDVTNKYKVCYSNNNSLALVSLSQLYVNNCLAICNKKKCVMCKSKPIISAK